MLRSATVGLTGSLEDHKQNSMGNGHTRYFVKRYTAKRHDFHS